jgi:transcription antitermination factor NusG
MPILTLEPTLYPEDLLEVAAIESSDRCWWAVHTKARQEKALARQLLQQQIPFYLPLIPKEHLIRGYKVCSHIPLFSGYVFVYADFEERYVSLTTNRVSRTLAVADARQLCRELRQIQHLITSNAPLTVERRLTPGRLVRIRSGSLEGLEGVVISRRAQARLLVTVSMLQQGVSVEIDDFLLEPID